MDRHRRNTLEVMRDGIVVRQRLLEVLADGPKTIPEMAELLGAPTNEVLLWVMAVRRYGGIEEVGRADENGYFRYALAPEEKA